MKEQNAQKPIVRKQSEDESSAQSVNPRGRKKYNVITEEVRKTIIHQIVDKKKNIKEVARLNDLKLSTCKAIVQVYQREGRIGKKSTRDRKSKIVNTVLISRIDPINPGQTTVTPYVFITEAKTASKKGDDAANLELIKEAFRNAQQHLRSVIQNNSTSIFLGTSQSPPASTFDNCSMEIEKAFEAAQSEALMNLQSSLEDQESKVPQKSSPQPDYPQPKKPYTSPTQFPSKKLTNNDISDQPIENIPLSLNQIQPKNALTNEMPSQIKNEVAIVQAPCEPIANSSNKIISQTSISNLQMQEPLQQQQQQSNQMNKGQNEKSALNLPSYPKLNSAAGLDLIQVSTPGQQFFSFFETEGNNGIGGGNGNCSNQFNQSPSISTMNASPAITPFLNSYTLNSPSLSSGQTYSSGLGGAGSFLSPLNIGMNGNYNRISPFSLNNHHNNHNNINNHSQSYHEEKLGYFGVSPSNESNNNYMNPNSSPLIQPSRSLFRQMKLNSDNHLYKASQFMTQHQEYKNQGESSSKQSIEN